MSLLMFYFLIIVSFSMCNNKVNFTEQNPRDAKWEFGRRLIECEHSVTNECI